MEKHCACGASITPRSKRCRRCTVRLAQARYDSSEKRKAKEARYGQSEKGRATRARSCARRIKVAGAYFGNAQTAEQAAAIKAHVKERLREFITRQQARAEAEGASSGAVSTEASA